MFNQLKSHASSQFCNALTGEFRHFQLFNHTFSLSCFLCAVVLRRMVGLPLQLPLLFPFARDRHSIYKTYIKQIFECIKVFIVCKHIQHSCFGFYTWGYAHHSLKKQYLLEITRKDLNYISLLFVKISGYDTFWDTLPMIVVNFETLQHGKEGKDVTVQGQMHINFTLRCKNLGQKIKIGRASCRERV